MRLKRKDFWALICDDWKYRRRDKGAKRDPMLCGVYSSKKEAQEVQEEIKDCLCTHTIKKCEVEVVFRDKK